MKQSTYAALLIEFNAATDVPAGTQGLVTDREAVRREMEARWEAEAANLEEAKVTAYKKKFAAMTRAEKITRIDKYEADNAYMRAEYSGCDWCCGGGDEDLAHNNLKISILKTLLGWGHTCSGILGWDDYAPITPPWNWGDDRPQAMWEQEMLQHGWEAA